jgi:cold shock CspA family protein
MAVGVVKFFNPQKGWGFITIVNERGSQDDCLVHYNEIFSSRSYKKLYQGQIVELDVTIGQKGPIAKNVKPTILNVNGQKTID